MPVVLSLFSWVLSYMYVPVIVGATVALALLHLFVDLLAPISKLSEHLQGDSTNLLLAQSAVEAVLVTLANAKDATYGEQLGKLVIAAENKLAEGENNMEFQSVPIRDVQDDISALRQNC